MKFIDYPHQYEYVFTDKEHINKVCNLDQIDFHGGIPEDVWTYMDMVKDVSEGFEKIFWDFSVKLHWLMKRFRYEGKPYIRRHQKLRKGDVPNSVNEAIKVLFINYINTDLKFWFHTNSPFMDIISYVDELYPNLLDLNPYTEEIKYPFKYMTIPCLSVVKRMDERMDLLRHCEEKKMTYSGFLDYIINYISCVNENVGITYFLEREHGKGSRVVKSKQYE
jgi:hypothetical protein